MKTEKTYIEVDYPASLYPFHGTAEVLIEYQTLEYEDGEKYKEILGCYVSEFTPEKQVAFCIERAKEEFYS